MKESGQEGEERKARRELVRRISQKTEEFNGHGDSRYCFVSEMDDGVVTLGVIVKNGENLRKLVDSFADAIGCDLGDALVAEVTLGTMENLLSSASRRDFIADDDDILERFGLDRIAGGRGRHGLEFGENLLEEGVGKEALLGVARDCFAKELLAPEIERIFEGRTCLEAVGHPVHYLVETDNRDSRREICRAILSALHSNVRLSIRRYSYLDFHAGQRYSHMAYESLYKMCIGGAVIVRYFPEGAGNDDMATDEQDTIENLCAMAKQYRNQVLTVLCLPRQCEKIKSQFYCRLGSMAFVEIREDFIDFEGAKAFLTERAKMHHVRADKKLFSTLVADRTYLATELQGVFDEWYNEKLRNSVYPQYKSIAVAQKEVVKAKPRGSAYDDLMEMIGLNEAKQVIKKALNYYKMQKLYEEKGVVRDTPAMHMIFSGNPGTAKTTVARLFARIMRENGLLSRGHLVEVGRGDLVGKYVGWTAQTVQAKFKEAKGGVLFIDEAYSLVDDRDGSYGDEAINTIVQEMENHRADVVVIFAGYPDKMAGFLAKNPGLRSRIAFHVPFADYDSGELCQIADMISRKNGMKIDKGALGKLEKAFDAAKERDDFGNGRYVRNLFEQAKMNQASRLLEKDFESITADEITTITAEDIEIPEPTKPQKRQIGFC